MKLKYDILEKFKKNLHKNYNENTAKTYYNAVKNALKDQQFGSVKEINVDKVLEYCKTLKVKNRVSAVKQGMLEFKNMDKSFKMDEYAFNDITKKKRNRRVKRFEPLKLSTTLRRINKIDDEKLKLAYRLMLVSGLRVAEIASLEGKDIKIDGDKLLVTVIGGKGSQGGKGNKDRVVESVPDKYLTEKISELLKCTKDRTKLFYSDSYMKKVARKNKFRCHDMRRVSAQIVYNGIDDQEKAVEAVQRHLGHNLNNTVYKKYLSRTVDFSGTKYADGGFQIE